MAHAPHVRVPAAREAPAEVLAALRAVSPRAELLYNGQGEWLLGECREEVARAGEGRRRLARLRVRPGRIGAHRIAHAMTQGFGLLEVLHGDPQAAWADRLARYVAVTPKQVEQGAEAALAEAEGAEARQRRHDNLREFARLEAGDILRFARRKTTGVSSHTVSAAVRADA